MRGPPSLYFHLVYDKSELPFFDTHFSCQGSGHIIKNKGLLFYLAGHLLMTTASLHLKLQCSSLIEQELRWFCTCPFL